MKNIVVYYSMTGNTESMAKKIASLVNAKCVSYDEVTVDDVLEYDNIVLGCPAMGSEELADEFKPLSDEILAKASGHKIFLFGSYGWGDGEWMRDWTTRMEAAGATVLNGEGLICHETPDEDGLSECRELGIQLANA